MRHTGRRITHALYMATALHGWVLLFTCLHVPSTAASRQQRQHHLFHACLTGTCSNTHPHSKHSYMRTAHTVRTAVLQGSDNIISFSTERYGDDHPLVVRGPGAGAEVTATGVFCDLLIVIRYHRG